MHIRHLIRSASVAGCLLSVGSWLPAHAGGSSQAAGASTSGLPICFNQPTGHRVSGAILSGPRLHGLTVDPKSGHLFVFSSGIQAVGGKPKCRAAILTLDGWNGRVLHITPLGNTLEPDSYNAMAVAPDAHRLLFLSTGNLQVSPLHQPPGTNNRLFIMDTRTGAVVKNISLPQSAQLGSLAVDNATYRGFVSYLINGAVPQLKVAIVAITRGAIVRTIDAPTQDIAVDQHTNRVFLLSSQLITIVNGATGDTINTVALPSGYYQYNGSGVDERTGRLLVTDVGLAPPHSGNPGNPPSIVAVINTTTGRLIKLVTAGNGVVAGEIIVDPPARIALSMEYNTNRTNASILRTADGSVKTTISLALPPGGFEWSPPGLVQASPVYDPHDGTIYGYTSKGIRALNPRRWSRSRVVTTMSLLLPLDLVVDPVTHRGYGLEWSTSQRDSVRGFCLRPNCS